MALQAMKLRKRSDYKYHLDYRLRWIDNDMYQHMNNNVYGHLFDAIVNQYLVENCGRSAATSTEIGIIVSSWANFIGSMGYPGTAECGLRVVALGKTSARYEIGIFEKGHEDVRAVGGFTHVFCDRASFRPQAKGMCEEVRSGLERIFVPEGEGAEGEKSKL